MQDLAPGDTILLNDNPAEVIKTYSVGNLDYLRAYVGTSASRPSVSPTSTSSPNASNSVPSNP